jgi:hypothetical protein
MTKLSWETMEEGEVEEILGKLESEFGKGNYEAAKSLGFWRVVRAAKKEPKLAENVAERIGRLDKLLFESKVWTKLDYKFGTAIELLGAIIGLMLLYFGSTSMGVESTVFYIASAIVLMTALHPISHSIAGKLFGIKFHFYFLDGPMLVEPTLKVDYSTYVRAPAKKRAIFHLAGAINSVLVTLIVFLVALGDPDAPSAAKVILGVWWLFTTSSELFPLIFIKLGLPKIFFADFKKTDSYRALREWRLGS